MIHMVHSQDNFVIEVCQLIHFSLDTHSNSICTNRSPTSNIDAFDFPMDDENIGLNQLKPLWKTRKSKCYCFTVHGALPYFFSAFSLIAFGTFSHCAFYLSGDKQCLYLYCTVLAQFSDYSI